MNNQSINRFNRYSTLKIACFGKSNVTPLFYIDDCGFNNLSDVAFRIKLGEEKTNAQIKKVTIYNFEMKLKFRYRFSKGKLIKF